ATFSDLDSSHIHPPIQILERKDYKLYSTILDMVSYSVRVGELVETLKMRALPEGSNDYVALVEFLKLYRDAVQLAVNKLWSLNEVPSIKTLHKMFYSELKRYGFRAHHVKQVYINAKAVVRVSKQNGGRKPLLRKLTARIDRRIDTTIG
ncbi:MAG: hypothetical protein QXS70_02860, partial [Desulfurococcaceae archaeon]